MVEPDQQVRRTIVHGQCTKESGRFSIFSVLICKAMSKRGLPDSDTYQAQSSTCLEFTWRAWALL